MYMCIYGTVCLYIYIPLSSLPEPQHEVTRASEALLGRGGCCGDGGRKPAPRRA